MYMRTLRRKRRWTRYYEKTSVTIKEESQLILQLRRPKTRRTPTRPGRICFSKN